MQKAIISDLLLEEVDISEDKNHWLITIGFNIPNANPDYNPLFATITGVGSSKFVRKYKVLKINAETGKVESMKIREK